MGWPAYTLPDRQGDLEESREETEAVSMWGNMADSYNRVLNILGSFGMFWLEVQVSDP